MFDFIFKTLKIKVLNVIWGFFKRIGHQNIYSKNL